MPQERSEAVALRLVDFSETSRIVTFLSPERGRLTCIAQGARRPKSPLAGALDQFNRVELVYYWKDGREIQKLGEVALLDGYFAIKSDLLKSLHGAVILELVSKIAHADEPSAALYTALVRGLEGLARWPGPAETHCCWQMLRILEAAGFAPNLEGAPARGAVPFAYARGVAEPGAPVDRRLSRDSFEALRALARTPGACPAVDTPEEAFDALVGFVSYHLESGLRSVRVLKEILRARGSQ